jgi:hypothetical protein
LADNGKIRVYSRYISIAPFSAQPALLTTDQWPLSSGGVNANHMFRLKDAIAKGCPLNFFSAYIH